ncbi:DinB family protein [Agrococcus versicolor]|uniref:DinB family protein n=1 Tax=Agrococcus versicolor TaxID=501482 RepID=A0ABP5M8T8_9MICO
MTHADDRERAVLLGALDSARAHVLAQVERMSDADLRRTAAPSGWTPLGLVRHLTLSDERFWFETVVAGGSLDWWPTATPGDTLDPDWSVPHGARPADVIEEYRAAIRRSDAIIASMTLDDAPRRPEPGWHEAGRFLDLRSIVTHVIVETSTHAGQLDVARELLDGGQHLVL